jgi:hypothetical protein
MADDVLEYVSVVSNDEIKTPVVVHPGLPSTLAFVVLLGAERWVMEIL